MNKSNKFSPEVRERAVRMEHEQRGEYPSLWAAVESIAPKMGCVNYPRASMAVTPVRRWSTDWLSPEGRVAPMR
jgi:hypothetical protein